MASELLESLGIELVWFDSLGAKCACIAVGSEMGKLVIDPGAAEMQPSYPLSSEMKRVLRKRAIERIEYVSRDAKIVIITHYHYDHHVLPTDNDLTSWRNLYAGKMLYIKNPNKYINESQWNRARQFLQQLLELCGDDLGRHLEEPYEHSFPDPVDTLEHALSKSFGDYDKRRKELLEKGRNWFKNLVELWGRGPWIREGIELPSCGSRIEWCDGKTLELGSVRVKIFEPWFHGVEYDRTGWVTPILIEVRNRRVFYTSDLMGPIIEDYAYRIADLRPEIVIADGPPTYLFPYMFNRINLQRAIDNAIYIIENAVPKLVIYDHHLLREKRWRERFAPVFECAKRVGVTLLTAAEVLGQKPLIDTITSS